MKDIFKKISRLEWLIAGSILAIFLVELHTPRGVVGWVFYGIPLFLTIRSPRKHLPYFVVAVCGTLMVIDFFVSPLGTFPVGISIASRSIGVLFFAAAAVLIDRLRRLESALHCSDDTLRALLSRLERTREKERALMARDVHDDLGQNLTAIKMDLRWIERNLESGDTPPLNAILGRALSAIELVDDATATVQELAAQLRPSALDRLGLGPAIQSESRRFQARFGIRCRIFQPTPLPAVTACVATAVFRVFQECITNVARHARASRIVVCLAMQGDDVLLCVQDNGIGIDVGAIESGTSLGLLGMKERALELGGDVVFHRGQRRGTRVTVRIPNHEK